MAMLLEGLDVLATFEIPILRLGVRHFLESHGARVVEAESGEECLSTLALRRFDVLIMDISLPRQTGLEIVIKLRDAGNPLPVLVMSAYPEEAFALRILRSGAQGYLKMSTPLEQLAQAIRTLANGRRYLTASIADLLADSVCLDGRSRHEHLSKREFEVFLHIGSGRSLSDTAAILGISPKTVSTLRERIMRKTGFSANMEIVRYAMQERLILPELQDKL